MPVGVRAPSLHGWRVMGLATMTGIVPLPRVRFGWPFAGVPKPELDPFYRARPDEFADLAPGGVLRVRQVDVSVGGLVPQRVDAWQILFRSSDLDGQPIVATTTVLLPWRARPRPLRPVLSYQCAIDAVAAVGFPSYALRRGARSFGGVPPWELLIIGTALRRGWAVSIPDHEGLDGRWGAPREPGYIALDGVRAAMSWGPLGLTTGSPVALWGYSGGGLATAWAAEVAPTYAPELDVVGAALGSPVGNPASVFLRLNKTRFSGLPLLFVAGLCRTYPEVQEVVDLHCTSEGRDVFARLAHMTTLAATLAFAGRDLDDLLDIPLADLLAQPTMVRILADIQLGVTAPSAPVLVTQAVNDRLIAADEIDELVSSYASKGARVTYIRDRRSTHASLHPLSAPMTINWIGDRFARRTLDAPRTATIASVVGPKELLGLANMTWNALLMLAAQPLRDCSALAASSWSRSASAVGEASPPAAGLAM